MQTTSRHFRPRVVREPVPAADRLWRVRDEILASAEAYYQLQRTAEPTPHATPVKIRVRSHLQRPKGWA